jgi:WS/DGAT/MGAT family acyltransferase
METPQVQMHVAFACVFSPGDMPGGYSFHTISQRIARAAQEHYALRRRLVHVPLDLHHPLWVDDPDFDVIHHVRHVALPAPGGEEELGAMVGRIYSTPLDRSRPLWEAWVIEGLEGGRFCLLMKFHHASVDGVAGSELLMHLLQTSPAPEPEKPVTPREPDRIPTDLEMVSFALRSKLKAPAQFANVLTQSVKFVDTVVKRRRDPEQDAGGTPLVAPRTPWNGAVSARRKLANARVPLETIKDIKNAFGTTVNDVVLAIAGSVLRSYLMERGALPSAPLTAVCPMSVRQKEEQGQANNKVSAMFVCLYTNIEDPVERLKEIHKTTKGAKAEHNALGADTLQNWAELAGPSMFASAVRFYSTRNLANRHRPIHNLVISNVPGPRFPLYLEGARLEAIYPLGPVMEGAGLNLTLMSYLDAIDFSFLVDAELVPDVWDMAHMTSAAVAELLEAGRAHRASQFPPAAPAAEAAAQPSIPAAPTGAKSDKAAAKPKKKRTAKAASKAAPAAPPEAAEAAPPARKRRKPSAKRKAT